MDFKYPYTDFHELNLDWFLAEFKKYYEKTIQQDEKIQSLDETVTKFTNFVTNYFDNLDVQQEINNKLDALVADGTISDLLQPIFNEFTSATISRMNVIESRMDTFTHLTDGSTTGDAELQDIRIAYDGTTYATAGDAVRAQAENLNDKIDDSGIYYVESPASTEWRQGWYGASTGAYDSSHTNAICCIHMINSNIKYIKCLNQFKMRLQAWSSGAYVGIWNGNTFTTVNPNYFQTTFDMTTFYDLYPTYQYKIVLFAANGSDTVSVSDVSNISYIMSEIDRLKPAEDVIDHYNIFDIAGPISYENRLGDTTYYGVYTIDTVNETMSTTQSQQSNGARYIVNTDRTLQPGIYTLSAYVSGCRLIAVNIGDQESVSYTPLKTDRESTTNIPVGSTSGWIYFTKTLTAPTKLRFLAMPYESTGGNTVIFSKMMLVKGTILPAYAAYDDAYTAIDVISRSVINAKIDQTVYQYRKSGEKINLKSQGYNVKSINYTLPNPADYGATSRQDFDIYDGVMFQLLDNNNVVLIDMSDGSLITSYSINCGHGNSCQFSKYKDDPSDDYPPFYCFDYETNKVYKNKVTNSSATLVETYILDISGYRFSGGYDSDNNIIVSVSYSQNSSTNSTGNYMTVAVWDLNNLTYVSDGIYKPTLIKSNNIKFIPTVQGCKIYNNRLIIISGYYPTYGFNVKISAMDYDGIYTTVLTDFPTVISQSEGEGISFINGKCYFTTYYLYELILE